MRGLSCLIIMIAAAPAAAQSLKVDVDGDGRVDEVRIEAPGQVVIERAGGGGDLVPFGISGTLGRTSLTATTRRPLLVVAVAQIGNASEAIVMRWQGGEMKELWRGPVGPTAGELTDFVTTIEARPAGVVRWQHRRDLDRCDGVPVELFAEGWDDAARKFRPLRKSVRLPDKMTAVAMTAERADAARSGGWYRVTGGTRMPGAADAGVLLPPRALDDGDPATVWSPMGDGAGDLIRYGTIMKGGKAAAIRIVHGRGAGVRVARLAVLGKDAAYDVSVPEGGAAGGDAFQVALPAPIEGCVTIAITAAHRRGSIGAAAIAELNVLADVELAPGGAEVVLAQQVAKGGITGESAARALAGRGLPAVAALSAELGRADATTRPRLLAALSRIEHPSVTGPLAAALANGELPPGDVVPAAERLARLGPDGVEALRELLRSTAPAPALGDAAKPIAESARLAAAGVLARTEPATLLDAAGRGSAEARAELVRLMAGAGVATLVARARALGADPAPTDPPRPAGDDAARADLWRAVARAAHTANGADRDAAAQAMAEALEATAMTQYELSYRLVAGVGEVGGADEVKRLLKWLRKPHPTMAQAQANALRRVAAGALGTNPAGAARRALAELAADRDAGTRLAAVRGLATEPNAARTGDAPPPSSEDAATQEAADAALAGILARDAWPELRRGAASALALRCQRRGPRAALETAITADAEIDVRVDALTALVTCRADGIAARLLRIADDGKAELALRDRAIALYGQLHAPAPGGVVPAAAIEALLDRLDRWRGQAFSDESALRLAVRTTTALGALGDRRAAPALVAAARDGTFPELQAAAAAALGALGPACPPDARTLLRALAQSEQRGVALAARGAIDRCKK